MRQGRGMRSLLMLVAGAALSACSATIVDPVPPPPTAGTIETIRYETGACFGACPIYVLTVSSHGRGMFAGRNFTAAKGVHSFAVTQAQFAEFQRRLEPYRPAGERRLASGEECNGRVATDLPS